MRAVLTLCNGERYTLPPLLEWEIKLTGSVPCDSFCVRFPYEQAMAKPLYRAVRMSLYRQEKTIITGIIDETLTRCTAEGLYVEVSGRGMAALLLDNEATAVEYEKTSTEEMVRRHAAPLGIACAAQKQIVAQAPYRVASGSSQWKALADFTRLWGGFTPRFDRSGALVMTPWHDDGRRTLLDMRAYPTTEWIRLDRRYGIYSEVVVFDRTGENARSVRNETFAERGGRCRRVIYMNAVATEATLRNSGEYQIEQSQKEKQTLTLRLPGALPVYPWETVRICGNAELNGDYCVTQAQEETDKAGQTATLTMREI